MLQNAKALVTSKTFLLAVAQAVLAVIVIFSSAFPDAGWLLLAKSVVDVILRVYTSQPISGIVNTN